MELSRLATLAAGCVLLLPAACTPSDSSVAAASAAAAPAPIVIAHRGFSAHAPEHTLPAFDLAHRSGADYLEQDLQLTADGVLVVLHDPTLDRTSADCAGPAIDMTLARLRDCDVGSWFNDERPDRARPDFAGLTVPTLEEVLERFGHTARYYIETKNPEEAPGMEEALVELLGRYDLLRTSDGLPGVYVQSFSPASLRKLRELAPDLPLVQLFGRMSPIELRDSLDAVREYAAGIGPHYSSVDGDVLTAARAAGLVVHPYTVNDSSEMRRLLDLGVDGFFTDDPSLGLRLARAPR